MMKRILDLAVSVTGLVVLSPFLAVILFLVWLQDGHSPFYLGPRIGLKEKPFKMVKIRSMVIAADRTGVESTSATDSRITPVGHFVRRWKVDEISQLWNVALGEMSLVGPRPNTQTAVSTYSAEEKLLLCVRPGITDISSIVFADEGQILEGALDPDAEYERLIRPWKSALGLVYVQNSSVLLDLRLVLTTIVAVFDRQRALAIINRILTKFGADEKLIAVARRDKPLQEFA